MRAAACHNPVSSISGSTGFFSTAIWRSKAERCLARSVARPGVRRPAAVERSQLAVRRGRFVRRTPQLAHAADDMCPISGPVAVMPLEKGIHW